MNDTEPRTIEVQDLTVLTFEPGDVVLVRVQHALSHAAADAMREQLRGAIPAGVHILIADQGTEIAALRGLS